jgi:hypothetical protein
MLRRAPAAAGRAATGGRRAAAAVGRGAAPLPLRAAPRRRAAVRVAAAQQQPQQQPQQQQESDFVFVAKGAAVSLVGAPREGGAGAGAARGVVALRTRTAPEREEPARRPTHASPSTPAPPCPAVGAAIKYGSLLVELPHRPNAAVALALVFGPPIAYAAWLLQRGSGSGGSSS